MAVMTAAMILMGVSTAIQVAGQVRAGNAARRAGEAQRRAADSAAELQEFNASVAEAQSADAIERGQEEEHRFRSTVKGVIGAQRAEAAAQGVDVSYGSAVDVQADAAMLGELDALTIRTNAAREAWGYQVQAYDYRKRADITRREGVMMEAAGREAQVASRYGVASTLVGSGASMLMTHYGFKQNKPVNYAAGRDVARRYSTVGSTFMYPN